MSHSASVGRCAWRMLTVGTPLNSYAVPFLLDVTASAPFSTALLSGKRELPYLESVVYGHVTLVETHANGFFLCRRDGCQLW